MAQSRQNFSHRDGGHRSAGTPIGRGITAEPGNGAARHYDDAADSAGDFDAQDGRYERGQYRSNGASEHRHDHGRRDYDRRASRGAFDGRSDQHEDQNGHDEDEYGWQTAGDSEGYEDHSPYHDHASHQDPMPDQHSSMNDSGGRMSVSILLREAREDAGYSLRDVSSILRIRLAHLESIEDGRFDDLPGTVYAVGFVRAYSDLVGLDGEEMVKRFKEEVSGVPDQTELHFPTPTSEGRVPGLGLVTIAVLLAGVAYGGWYYVSEGDREVGDFIPALPDRFAGLLEGWTGETPQIDEIAESSAIEGEGSQTDAAPSEDEDSEIGAASEAPTDPALPTVPGAVGEGSDGSSQSDVAASPDSEGSNPDSGTPDSGTPDSGTADASTPNSDTLIDPTSSSGALAGRDIATPETDDSGTDDSGPDDSGPDDSGTDAATDGGAEDGIAAAELDGDLVESEPTTEDGGPTELGDVDDPQSPSVLASDTPSDTAVAVPGFDDPALSDSESDEADQAENELGGATPNGDDTASGENGVGNGGQQVLIQAESDSWVQIRDSVGSLLMTRVMRAGEVYEVPDEAGLTMVTGNAGGLQVTVGGESVPPLGGAGDVVRGIRLEPGALLDGSAGP